jgi:NAD(P)-dependent dehydrogenase (short-subunit alcohol dehydrogenase family)
MKDKVVVITGATSGIGEIAAQRLAAMGARIVLVARNAVRGQKTLTSLAASSSGVAHSIYYGNLSLIAETKRVAAEIRAAEPRIDVLINNAGALFGKRELTADGLEETFATNHMAYFVLTLALRDSLFAASSARVVSTASDAHKGYTLDFDDLQAQKGYSAIRAYGRSKLCNILFTRELGRRFSGKRVTANCLHPGFVATRFGDGSGGLLGRIVGLAKTFAITPEKGAQTIVYLASSPEVSGVSGDYFYKCRIATPTAGGRDDAAAKRLWAESAKIAAIDYE